MDESPRDTQFQGFAKLVQDEQIAIEAEGHKHNWNNIDIYRRQRELLARRAYDLVDIAICHVAMGMSNDSAVMFVPRQNAVRFIPDMTELPKEQEPTMQIMGEYIAENETVTFPGDPDRQPRKISVTLDNGDIFEGIVHYAGNVTEQEP